MGMRAATRQASRSAIQLRTTVSKLSRHIRVAARVDGISTAKLAILGQLYRFGPQTATGLARRESVKPQSLTRLLAELETSAWIVRRPHRSDGRQLLLSLTRRGTTRLVQEMRRREAILTAAIDIQLSASEQGLLQRACLLIDRITDSIEVTHMSSVHARSTESQ